MPTVHFFSRSRALAIMPLLVVGACSTGGQTITSSGFLPGYAHLHKAEGRRNTALWVAPTFQPARYRNVIVAVPEWHAPPRGADVQSRLTNDLRAELIERLAERYRVAERARPGSSTLRVRAAITNVRPTRWYLNVPAQAASFALGGIGVFAPLQGGASEEIQVEDVQTGAVLVQIATYRNGKAWNVKGSYVAYEHARMAFRDAARQLGEILAGPVHAAH